MSFPSLFTLIHARAPLRRRGACAWVAACLLFLVGLFGSGAAQATVYNFNGNAVDTCSLSNKVYTCPYPAYLDWDDSVVIASGYTLKVTNNVAVSWNQGLSMSSGAKLIVTGDLNLKDINPSNLKISGGDIEVGGTFSMGASAQSAVANITAGAIQLGTDKVTITGNLSSRGVVNISSYSRITGDVKGTVVTTGSPATITGNVTASSKFSLASGSSVTGDVTAPVFDMLASGSKVTGAIVATTSMTMGSGNTVTGNISTGSFKMEASGSQVTGDVTATGDMTMGSGTKVTGNVDTGDLLLQSSSALITGNARVNWATLEWAGRVTGTIYCKNGTKKNKCDCVTNNSGYDVNTANGPRCEGLAPSTPHHFLITHDGQGDTCLPEKITVTACANASCTAPHFTGAASGKLTPFGVDFAIPANAGSQVVSVTRFAEGAVTLGLSGGTAQAATTCYQSANNTNSCAMSFAGGIKLLVDVPNHAAGAGGILATIQGVKANASQTACVAAFENKTYDVSYSCNYSKPKAGTEKLTLGAKALACGASTATAVATSITTEFKANGIATLALAYPDAGEVRLNASAAIPDGVTATGSGTFIAAPAKFTLAATDGPLRAGANFSVAVTAVNTAGVKTPNFDTADLNAAGATSHEVALDIACRAQNGVTDDLFASDLLTFKDGVAKPNARWSEVGRIDLAASLNGFMGVGTLKATGTTNEAAAGKCSGNVGVFIPQYFKIAIERPASETNRKYHYSREPFSMKVSAMSAAGLPTRNFDATVKNQTTGIAYTEDVNLSVVGETGAALPGAAPGALYNGPDVLAKVPAASFAAGSVTLQPHYAFTALKTAPLTIRLRGANGKPAPADVTSAFTASPDPDADKEAKTSIRSGRLRLVNRFGSARGELKMPVIAEIWSGNSWVQHTDDIYTAIPSSAFAITSRKQTAAAASAAPFVVTKPNTEVKMVNGIGSLALTPTGGGPGWGDVAANLGLTNVDSSCLVQAFAPVSTGAKLPWLRSLNVCSKNGSIDIDPSARATFGVFVPETKRIIHVREAFN